MQSLALRTSSDRCKSHLHAKQSSRAFQNLTHPSNMWNDGPFALFVLVKLRRRTIDGILRTDTPHLWLATRKYDDAPQKKQPPEGVRRPVGDGTVPPIANDFKSPWIGSTLDELVQWLKNKPEDVDLDEHHFAILDKGAKDEPLTVVICRIGGIDFEGDQLYLFRKPILEAINQLIGAPPDSWTELTTGGERNAEIKYDN